MASGVSAGNTAAGRKLAWEGGQLCQLLRSPDYNLFPNSAVFESDFVQVTKAGKCVDFTNMPTVVSMGVTSSDPCLPLPNVLLMARRKVLGKGFVAGNGQSSELPVLDLSRLLPLRCVKLSVHHAAQRILCLQTVTRKVYYLQLHQGYPKAVFGLWSRLADILQRGLSITAKDPAVHIRHSLVPSGSSPSSSSSGEVSDAAASRSRRRTEPRGQKGPPARQSPPGKAPWRRGSPPAAPRRVSFQELPAQLRAGARGDVSAVHSGALGRLRNVPPLPGCTRCKGQLPCPSGEPPFSGQHRGVSGIKQQGPVSWLQPLCRLRRSNLEDAGRK